MGVRELYIDLLKKGNPPKEAAKIVQRETGLSAVTGKPIKKPYGGKVKYARQYQ